MISPGDAASEAGKPMRRWARWANQAHVMLPVIAAVLLAVIWTATVNLIRVERTGAERAATLSTRELLGTYEAQVVRALREIDQTLRLVQYSYDLNRERDPLLDLKTRQLLPPDLLFTVSIADRHGNIVASTRRPAPKTVAAEDYFTSLSSGKDDFLAIGRPARGPTADGKLQFSRRLTAADGTFSGIAMVSVDAAYFVSGYEQSKLGTQGLLGVLGIDGAFRVRRTGDLMFSGDSVSYAAIVQNSPQDDDVAPVAISSSSWDGVRRYTSARQLYDFPVAVVVGLSENEQLAAARGNIRSYLRRAAIGSTLVVALGLLLARMSWQLIQSGRRETEAKIAHAQRVEYLAYHDSLTALPNRSLFSKLLGQSIAQAQRHSKQLAVAFLDLDRFKQINDTLGHEAGDQLLQEVAFRLKSCVRDSDTVARLGGDEFVVLLPELAEEHHAASVAQKILTAIAKPFMLIGQEFRVTASIGISTYPQDGLDEQTLTKNADIAMYQAKEEGKNNFQFYSAALNANSLERLSLESSLRHALERGEFLLHYQAKREVGTGRVTGMEALLRWDHPDLGTVAPLQFIPIAEETGIIVPIGKWVLTTACRQNVAWQKQGLPRLNIAVNLTARQFTDERLLEDVASILQATGMDATLLELEIAESLLIRDVDKTLEILTKLKTIGVRIAIDDFGTGYSSLSTLQRFPLDTIKIDRSFIRDVNGTTPDECLTNAVISMGRALSLTVVAQGVETREQAEFLRKHPCDELQGFYFAKPVPADQATELLRAQVPDVTYIGLRAALGVKQ